MGGICPIGVVAEVDLAPSASDAVENTNSKNLNSFEVTRQATCRACGGPIPSREGKFALSYLLLRTAVKSDPTAPERQHCRQSTE